MTGHLASSVRTTKRCQPSLAAQYQGVTKKKNTTPNWDVKLVAAIIRTDNDNNGSAELDETVFIIYRAWSR